MSRRLLGILDANMKGLGLTPLFGDRRGFMPPQLKKTEGLKSAKKEKQECHLNGLVVPLLPALFLCHIKNNFTPLYPNYMTYVVVFTFAESTLQLENFLNSAVPDLRSPTNERYFLAGAECLPDA